MKFDELPLYIAVHQVYAGTDKPGAESWVAESIKDLYVEVLRVMVLEFDFVDDLPTMEDVRSAWRILRKSGGGKARIIAEIAPSFGRKCFYAGRADGECSDEIDLDRIVPGSRGGEYTAGNCVLSCSHHNRSRGDKPIEDFIGRWPEDRTPRE